MDDLNTKRRLMEEYGNDCGSFDLMTGFVASNESMPATDMTSLDETDTDKDASDPASLDNINNTQQATKRTKLDKDGFVTPTTPDISIRTNHHIDSDAELKALSETGIPGDDMLDGSRLSAGLDERELMGAGEAAIPPHQLMGVGEAAVPPHQVGHDDMDSIATSCTSFTDLLKAFGERSKMLNTDWSYAFIDSENFEKFCITRLDRMLEDANELEIDLRRQKDVLREKLLNLSRTLQLD